MSLLSRWHFRAIGDLLERRRPVRSPGGDATYEARLGLWQALVEDFAHWLRETNPLFDRPRFLRRCGYPEVP